MWWDRNERTEHLGAPDDRARTAAWSRALGRGVGILCCEGVQYA